MEIRPTHPGDVTATAWSLHPHAWCEGGLSYVQTDFGQVRGAVMCAPNPVHPTRDNGWIYLTDGANPQALLATLRQDLKRPISFEVQPNTAEHAALLEAGAEIYQHRPAQMVTPGTPEIATWCERHQLLPVDGLTRYDDELMVDLWSTYYEIVFSPWAPCAEYENLLEEFAYYGAEMDRKLSGYVQDHAVPVAAAFCFEKDNYLSVSVEALVPDHAWAREAVGSLMSHVLRESKRHVCFDGYQSNPHFYPLLQTLPDVRPGAGCPADLMQLG